jgi:large subunit ribosomal protein L18
MNLSLEKKVRKSKIKGLNMSEKRKKRTRVKLKKVSSRSRLSVFRSNNHIYAQVIDDTKGLTLASASSLENDIYNSKISKKELAELIGKKIAERTIEKGIKDVAFDKGKYKYHGLIKILADSARSKGLNF